MICPECGEENNRVLKTYHRTNENIIERVRQCLACGHPFLTEEVVSPAKKKCAREIIPAGRVG
jgi:transcriptional regulator NrdR family protein